MKPSGGDVDAFVASTAPDVRRADAAALVALMHEETGAEPELRGNIVVFGSYRYRYGTGTGTGTEGDAPAVAFAPVTSAGSSARA